MSSAMTEVRLVGRGGQGIVTAGDVAGRAAVGEGRWAQSMPTFGPERRGALTQSTLRIADEPIRLKCTASNPSVVLVIDPTIWRHVDVTRGLDADAIVIVNTPRSAQSVRDELQAPQARVYTVDATSIAMDALGRPIPNTAMLGALVRVTQAVGMPALEAALQERFGTAGDANVTAARLAHQRLTGLGA